VIAERPAAGDPEGLLVLHHGRGTSEQDLIGFADVLDPGGRLHVAAPRGPLQIPGQPGFHWYVVPRVGYPDPETFFASRDHLAQVHDELWERVGVGPERTVLGGFSQGTVMSYALALDPARPTVGGILAFSGFIPTVEGWAPDLSRPTPVFIAHGRRDPIIGIEFGHAARDALADVEYHESDVAHSIDRDHLRAAVTWLA
jgi:phospholipase/carboxylesterase